MPRPRPALGSLGLCSSGLSSSGRGPVGGDAARGGLRITRRAARGPLQQPKSLGVGGVYVHDRAKVPDGFVPLARVEQHARQMEPERQIVGQGLHGPAQAGDDGNFRFHAVVLLFAGIRVLDGNFMLILRAQRIDALRHGASAYAEGTDDGALDLPILRP
jgi:hypothetical protein